MYDNAAPNGPPTSTEALRRISTGVTGIDDILDGGLPAGHLYLR